MSQFIFKIQQTVFVECYSLCFPLTDFGKVVYTSLRRLKVLLVCTYLFSMEAEKELVTISNDTPKVRGQIHFSIRLGSW